ncbi:MAG: thioredoxin [Bacteroidetes bacterium]|nr:thioredoxin [Bacteroidota bacterium]
MSKFDDLINSDQPVLVDFSAEWCGPCKMMAPILKEVASNLSGKARIIKVNIDKNPSAAEKFSVQSIPTLIIFKNGKIKWRQSGVLNANQLTEIIKQYS